MEDTPAPAMYERPHSPAAVEQPAEATLPGSETSREHLQRKP
jgi:hypothetical protein